MFLQTTHTDVRTMLYMYMYMSKFFFFLSLGASGYQATVLHHLDTQVLFVLYGTVAIRTESSRQHTRSAQQAVSWWGMEGWGEGGQRLRMEL